jgi:uncharacterized protein YbcI
VGLNVARRVLLSPLLLSRDLPKRGVEGHFMTDALHAADAPEGQSVGLAVSNAMVRLYKEQFGRGPTKAATHYAGPDCLISTLENSLTPAERTMVALGEHQRLRDVRLFFQHASEEQFRGIIEEITGRTVRAFVSGMDTHRDVSSEVFYLEPEG